MAADDEIFKGATDLTAYSNLGRNRAFSDTIVPEEDANSEGKTMSKFVIAPHFRLQEWVAEEKLMATALRGYRYVEDGAP